MPFMRTIKFLVTFICLPLLCLALLTACGQKGPLVLPDQDAAAAPAPEQEQGESAVPEEALDGEPVPDTVPDAVPDPAAVEDDESP